MTVSKNAAMNLAMAPRKSCRGCCGKHGLQMGELSDLLGVFA